MILFSTEWFLSGKIRDDCKQFQKIVRGIYEELSIIAQYVLWGLENCIYD
jgi:hypothetical protein